MSGMKRWNWVMMMMIMLLGGDSLLVIPYIRRVG